MRLDGLVVDAPPPWNMGSRRARITLVVRPPGGVPLSVRAKLEVTKDNWLVRGMSVPVEFDPSDPERARIDEDAIVPLEERVAAGDPALVDPITAVRAAREAIEAAADASMATQDAHTAGIAREMRVQMRSVEQAERDERLRAAEERFSTGPATAPDGRRRGYGRLVAVTPRRPGNAQSGGNPEWFTDAIYSIRLIGEEPYAVVKRYKRTDRREGEERYDVEGAGVVPVLVDPTDREDIEILWDEVPDFAEGLMREAMGAMDAALRQAAPLVEAMTERMFEAVPDPAMRTLMADQMRAQGWTVPEGAVAAQRTQAGQLAKLDALLASGVLTQDEYDQQVARLSD